MNKAPAWQLRRWPQLDNDASTVPQGKRPRQGVEYGCGNRFCHDCYEDDPSPAPRLRQIGVVKLLVFDNDQTIILEGDLESVQFAYEAVTIAGLSDDKINFMHDGYQWSVEGFFKHLNQLGPLWHNG
jgi:hypothetical protein